MFSRCSGFLLIWESTQKVVIIIIKQRWGHDCNLKVKPDIPYNVLKCQALFSRNVINCYECHRLKLTLKHLKRQTKLFCRDILNLFPEIFHFKEKNVWYFIWVVRPVRQDDSMKYLTWFSLKKIYFRMSSAAVRTTALGVKLLYPILCR